MRKVLFPIAMASVMVGCVHMKLDGVDYEGKATSDVDMSRSNGSLFMKIDSVNGQETSVLNSSVSLPEGEYDVSYSCYATNNNLKVNNRTFHYQQRVNIKPESCYGFAMYKTGYHYRYNEYNYIHTDPVTGNSSLEHASTRGARFQNVKEACDSTRIVKIACDSD